VNYQSATHLGCWMFTLGAVFAPDVDTAIKIATDNDMTGPEATIMHEVLSRESIATIRRLGRNRTS
jgi:hypothetical protein